MVCFAISIIYRQKDNPDLELAKRLFDALETEAANSKTPSTAFAARIMLSDVIDERILEDFPHLDRYRKFYARTELEKSTQIGYSYSHAALIPARFPGAGDCPNKPHEIFLHLPLFGISAEVSKIIFQFLVNYSSVLSIK